MVRLDTIPALTGPSTAAVVLALPSVFDGDDDNAFSGLPEDLRGHESLKEFVEGNNLEGLARAHVDAHGRLQRGGDKSAWDRLPENLRTHNAVKQFVDRNDFEGFAKSYLHAQTKLSQRGLTVPGKDASEDDWSAVWDALGRPKSADDYEIVGEVDDSEKEQVAAFKQILHAAGLTPQQSKVLQEKLGEMESKAHEQAASVTAELRRVSQATIDNKFADRRAFEADEATGARLAFGGDDEELEYISGIELADGQTLGTHPIFRIAMARIGALAGEDGVRTGPVSIDHRYSTAADIQQKIDSEYAKAQSDESHPGHLETTASREDQRRWQDEMFELQQKKFAKDTPAR